MISHLTKLAFTPESDLSLSEVISNVSDGVDEATSFGYEPDYEFISVEDEQRLPFKAVHGLTAVGLPASSVTKQTLIDLNDPDSKAKIAALGIDGALICQNPVHLEFLDKPDTGNFWKFYLTLATVPYRERSTGRKGGGLHVGENLLSVYSFTDEDSDGVANGWTNSGYDTASFAAGVQTLDKNADGSDGEFEFESIYFPFEGTNLTFSIDVDSITDGGHAHSIQIQFLDDAGAEISTEDTPFSSTGRKSASANIPSGTKSIVVKVITEDNAAANPSSIDISEPALRIDGKDHFTAY